MLIDKRELFLKLESLSSPRRIGSPLYLMSIDEINYLTQLVKNDDIELSLGNQQQGVSISEGKLPLLKEEN